MEGFPPVHGGYEPVKPRGPRPTRRNATDIGSTYVYWNERRRPKYYKSRGFEAERSSPSYVVNMLPPAAVRGRPADSVPGKYLHTSYGKNKHPVNAITWTPEGRRLLTAATSGEFVLWNGTGFNFESIMQAHDCAIRALRYAHNDDWLLSADQDGVVKYWQTNLNNVKDIQAHKDPVRDIAFAPTDVKFVTASDDASLKIFDFASGLEELVITGHQWDAKCVDWHPSKGLLASGSRDHQIKLWDPRNGRCLTTLYGHKNQLSMVKFQPTEGNLLASCAREPTSRVFDIRMMRDVFLVKAQEKEMTALTWHPFHANLLSIGGSEGALSHYLITEQNVPEGWSLSMSPYDARNPQEAPAQPIWPRHRVPYAHESSIFSMAWHPLGHILATGSNDKATRFWTRPRPGDDTFLNDRWHIGQQAAEAKGTWKRDAARNREEEEDDESEALPDQNFQNKAIPGLSGLNSSLLPGLAQPAILPGAPAQLPVMPPMPFQGMPLPPSAPELNFEQLRKMFEGQPPPLSGMPALPPNFIPPPGFPPLPLNGMPTMIADANGGNGIRKRGPLPSQQDSLKAEMREGRYTKIR